MPRGVNRPPLLAHDFLADAIAPTWRAYEMNELER
jgi:hypothetical protein